MRMSHLINVFTILACMVTFSLYSEHLLADSLDPIKSVTIKATDQNKQETNRYQLGEPINFYVKVEGKYPPYTYRWQADNADLPYPTPSIGLYGEYSSFTYTFNIPAGWRQMFLFVSDAYQNPSAAVSKVYIGNYEYPKITADISSPKPGEVVTFTGIIQPLLDGPKDKPIPDLASTYTYFWRLEKITGSDAVHLPEELEPGWSHSNHRNSISYSMPSPGTWIVYLYAEDKDHEITPVGQTDITVQNAGDTGDSGPTSVGGEQPVSGN